jgi:hypothetical protein
MIFTKTSFPSTPLMSLRTYGGLQAWIGSISEPLLRAENIWDPRASRGLTVHE